MSSLLGLGLTGSDIVQRAKPGGGGDEMLEEPELSEIFGTFVVLPVAVQLHLGSEVRLHSTSSGFEVRLHLTSFIVYSLTTNITKIFVTICYREFLAVVIPVSGSDVWNVLGSSDRQDPISYKRSTTPTPTLSLTHTLTRLSSAHHGTRLLQAIRGRQGRL